MSTPFDIAQARLKAVEQMNRILARQRAQNAELAELRARHDTLLLNGTPDLPGAVHQYESELIKFALRASDKSVVRAAAMLNVSYQWLSYTIESRHQELLPERSIIRKRKA